MNNEFATIKLTVRGMEHSIVQALNLHEKQLQKDIEKAVKEAVSEFDFKEAIKLETQRILRNEISISLSKKLKYFVEKTVSEGVNL